MNAVAEIAEELICLEDGGAVFAQAWANGWEIPDPVPVDIWADTHRVLPRESSSEPGPWRTDRTPYIREVMQCLSPDHSCKKVVFIAATQVAKTEVGNNWIGSIIHQTPAPVMVVQPTVDIATKRWARQRFNPMVEHTKVLQGLIKPARSRDSGNTSSMKEFPGGVLVIAGANSAAALRSTPVRFLFLDEVDAYPSDVDGEGNPIDLAERRTSTFPRRKILITSTPTIKDASAIEEEFEASDQRHYYVPCPHCEHKQILRDDNLTDNGTFLCEACGQEIEEHHKTWMLANGEWRPHNPDSNIPGFKLPSYYAPVGLGYTWLEITELRSAAKENPEKSKTYTNTIMAETYEDESGKVDWKEVAERAGGYISRTIPDGCLLLTAGVDTQDDRWEVHILGFGRKFWCTIDYQVIPGQPGIEEEWEKLDAVLDASFLNQYGVSMKVLAMGIDTGGHHTHTAYQYCRTRKHRRVLAMKGSKFQGRPIIPSRPSPQDVNVRGRIIRAGVDLWHIGTDTAKGAIFARLQADAGVEPEECRFRFPGDLPDEFFQQLTAERYDTTKQRWVKPRHKRNEVTDTTVYGLASACHPEIRIDKLRDNDWAKIEAKVQPVIQDMFSGAELPPVPAPREEKQHAAVIETEAPSKDQPNTQPTNKPKRRKKRKGGFVGGWSK